MANPPLGDGHQDEEAVRQFFDQWEIYKKVVANNYLHHREAYAAIGRILDGIAGPFSFLDLGAGDAAWTSQVLVGREPASYEAVDISGVALDLARENLREIPCGKKFTQGDFFLHVRERRAPSDVIFIGLSLHHLPLADKGVFFSTVRPLIPEGGCLIFYEPVCELGETRAAVLERWWESAQHWTALTGGELAKAKEHVFGSDYPESQPSYEKLAGDAGFSRVERCYLDEDCLYGVFVCA